MDDCASLRNDRPFQTTNHGGIKGLKIVVVRTFSDCKYEQVLLSAKMASLLSKTKFLSSVVLLLVLLVHTARAQSPQSSCLFAMLHVAGIPADIATRLEGLLARAGVSIEFLLQHQFVFRRPTDSERFRECFGEGPKSDDCLNFQICSGHGTCEVDSSGPFDTYTCQCDSDNYTAPFCEERRGPCHVNPCQNGGTCLEDPEAGFRCVCSSGFAGELCQLRFTPDGLLAGVLSKLERINGRLEALDTTLVEKLPPGASGRVDYKVFSELVNWTTAVSRCRSIGGGLASIRSTREQARASRARSHLPQPVWIGASDAGREGNFVWTDLTTVSLTSSSSSAWQRGEPNNSQDRENCVVMDGESGIAHIEVKSQWNDVSCSNRYPYMCEYASTFS